MRESLAKIKEKCGKFSNVSKDMTTKLEQYLQLKKTIDKSVDEANSSILNVNTENRIVTGEIEQIRDEIKNYY